MNEEVKSQNEKSSSPFANPLEIPVFPFSALSVSIVSWRLKVPIVFEKINQNIFIHYETIL